MTEYKTMSCRGCSKEIRSRFPEGFGLCPTCAAKNDFAFGEYASGSILDAYPDPWADDYGPIARGEDL